MPLIEGSAAKRLMQRELIHRAILGTLLREKLPPAPRPEPRNPSGQRRNANRPGGGGAR
jgi:hypothetical protein